MRLAALALIAVITAGCGQRSVALDARWRPLERVVEASWVGEDVYTTIAPNVYVKHISTYTSESPDWQEIILTHEQVHARRELDQGVSFYRDYGAFPSVRWQEEKLGYAAQFALMKQKGYKIDVDWYANFMSGPAYYGMVDPEVARAWVAQEARQ